MRPPFANGTTTAVVAWPSIAAPPGFYTVTPLDVLSKTARPAITTEKVCGPRPPRFETDADFAEANWMQVWFAPELPPGTYTFTVQTPDGRYPQTPTMPVTLSAPEPPAADPYIARFDALGGLLRDGLASIIGAVGGGSAALAAPVVVEPSRVLWFRPTVPSPPLGMDYDGSQEDALRYAGAGRNPFTGDRAFGSPADLEAARVLCDKLSVATSAKAASDLIPRAGDLDTDAALFLVMIGMTQGGGLAPLTFSIFPAEGSRLSDAIAAARSGGSAGTF